MVISFAYQAWDRARLGAVDWVMGCKAIICELSGDPFLNRLSSPPRRLNVYNYSRQRTMHCQIDLKWANEQGNLWNR